MAKLSDYTSPDEIRAVLGASEVELEDETLQLPIYELMWTSELSDIYVGLEPLLDDIAVRFEADPDSVTLTEKQLLATVKVFSAYATSKSLYTNRAFSAKKIEDGKAAVERFADGFAVLMDGILAMYEQLLARIRRLLRALGLDVPDPVYNIAVVGVANLGVDPVTGE